MDRTNNDINDPDDTTVASRLTFNDPQGPPPSIVIAMALAKLKDTPPSQADFTLADNVDPDALDDLVTDSTRDVRVEFTVEDYLIVAQGNGIVQIQDAED